MEVRNIFKAWGSILTGRAPLLSIEITKECPLRCPGCYAFDPAHLGGGTVLRGLNDYKGDDLVRNVLALVDERKPMHVSLVGGDPLVRYRELDRLLPELARRGIHTQLVTSAFRVIPAEWMQIPNLCVAVSIDGLQPEHDERRKPATYERILKSIRDARVTIHCTITAQFAERPGYLEDFLKFWSAQPAVWRVWFSLFTPQRGAADPEILSPAQRTFVIAEMKRLRAIYPILNMDDWTINAFAAPPASPAECIFARTTETVSADLTTRITPCQFGGEPDCAQCGCIASMGMAAIGNHKLGPLKLASIFLASDAFGKRWSRLTGSRKARVEEPAPFQILS